MLFERVGDEEQLVLEPERAGVGHSFHEEVAGVLEWGEAGGKRARRGAVA